MHTSSNRGGTVKLLLWSSIGSVWNWQWRESECLQSLPLPLKPLPDCNDIEKPVLLVLCWLVKEVWQVEVKVVSVSKRQCPGTCQQFCSDTWIHANVVGRFWKEKKPMQMKSAQTEPGFFFNSVSHVILFLLCFVSFHFKAWQSWTKKWRNLFCWWWNQLFKPAARRSEVPFLCQCQMLRHWPFCASRTASHFQPCSLCAIRLVFYIPWHQDHSQKLVLWMFFFHKLFSDSCVCALTSFSFFQGMGMQIDKFHLFVQCELTASCSQNDIV